MHDSVRSVVVESAGTVQEPSANQLYIVGIGASAGGLHPLELFFENLPSDTGACFVVVQHLSPDFKSLMKELLERRTNLPVHKVQNEMLPCANAIYLIPPGQNLVIHEGRFRLISQDRSGSTPHYPINRFFQSLAENYGDRALGVILSGTGSDGTRGLLAINEAAGLTLVQDPDTAEFSGMPNSAIQTRIIDQVLPPSELALTIARMIHSPQVMQELRHENNDSHLAAPYLTQIIQILNEKEAVDFSHYKESTLCRRLHRRCIAAGFQSLSDYAQHLSSSEEERLTLKSDLLIKVSYFFRNPEAWSFLEKQVLPGLLEVIDAQRPLRMWCAACATGEEAYSLAIMVHELADRAGRPIHAKIFATDLDQAALDYASQGIYPDTIRSDVPERLLNKYFERKDDGFEISRQIRKMVIFAHHNLVQDAGFTRLHFVSCRNVLIYMQGQLQQKVLHSLNFSLRSNGILFLGESETLGDAETAFTTLQKRWRIYRKFRTTNVLNIPKPNLQERWLSQRSAPKRNVSSALDPILESTLRSLVSRQNATCLIVDRNHSLVHVAGGTADLLVVPEGRLTNELSQRVVPALRLPLATALNRASRSGSAGASYRGISLPDSNPPRMVKLNVWSPSGHPATDNYLIVLIEADGTEANGAGTASTPLLPLFEPDQAASNRIKDVENELQQTRENLQATIEELETTNEEQQATNEELIASNEELQSTNEELHSVNEELYTVNSEYESKIQELLELNSDIDNLLKSTEIGVIFLDNDLHIRKFTPAVRAVIKLVSSDIGRSIADLSHEIESVDFRALLEAVLVRAQPESLEVQLRNGRHMLMRLHPYQTTNQELDGIVISFVEISRLKQTEQELREAEQQLIANNRVLEDRVADRTRTLQCFSTHLRQLHRISTSAYASEALMLQAYLEAGCSIFGLTTGSLIYFQEGRLSLKSFYSQELEGEIGRTFPNDLTCTEEINCPWLPWSQRQKSVGCCSVDALLELSEHPIYADSGIQSYLATKIQLADQCFGILEFAALASRDAAFEQHELELLELIAAGIANGIARERTQRTLIEREAEYRNFYNETPVMLHSMDASGHLLSVSDYWLEKMGYAREEVLGHPSSEFVTEASHQYEQQVVWPEFSKLGSCLDVPYQMVRRDGPVMDVLLSAIAERDSAGEVHRTLAVLVDVTESRRLQSELEQAQALAKAKATAEIANRAKSRFLANITHELRTPLNSVLGFSELLSCDRTLGEEPLKQVETIQRAGKHLLSLINDMLDLSKIEAEQIAPVYSHFDLSLLLEQEIWNLFHQQAAVKGLRFEILQDGSVPQFVYTDPVRLRQILINLIGNGIKFTAAGQVILRVSSLSVLPTDKPVVEVGSELVDVSVADVSGAEISGANVFGTNVSGTDQPVGESGDESGNESGNESSDESTCQPLKGAGAEDVAAPPSDEAMELLRFSIIDTGPGIALQDRDRIFEPFSQFDGPHDQEGAGLGLSISYQLALLLGGDIAVESEQGEGSTFTLTLPIQRSNEAQGVTTVNPRDVMGLAPGQTASRILVIEDDLDNQQFLVSLLKQVGFQVQAIGDTAKALSLWERWQPHLVFINVHFPQEEGKAIVRHIKNTPQGQDTPVIVLTTSTFRQQQSEIIATGCDSYLKKPVDAAQILSTIQQYLKVAYVYSSVSQAATEPSHQPQSILSVSRLSQLQALWLDDFYQALAIGATVQMYQLIDQLPPEDSEVAIALERQISQYQFQGLLDLFAPLCEH